MADGMFGAVASGAASGAGQGASVGSLIPGVGTAVGAGVGAIAGGIGSAVKQNKATQAQQIPLVDPLERARLASLEQTRKNVAGGTDVLTQQGIQQQQNIGKAAQTALSRSTGGDVGQTMNALLQSQKATQGGINQAVAGAQNRIPYLDSAQGNLLSRISDRKVQLQRLKRDQLTAENAQARTDANINTQALLATQGGLQTIPEGVAQAGQQLGALDTSNLMLGARNALGRLGVGGNVTADAFAQTQPYTPNSPQVLSGGGLNVGSEVGAIPPQNVSVPFTPAPSPVNYGALSGGGLNAGTAVGFNPAPLY